jgi:hypothetical protein
MKPKDVTILQYQTLRDCLNAFLGYEPTDDELKNHQWQGYNGGAKYNVNCYRWLKGTKRKAWGWAEYRRKSIHLWSDADCSENELMKVLAHEAAHLKKPRPKDKREEEKKAAMVEACCGFAQEVAHEILVKRH